mgnify:CR=1 FL=1
MTSRDIKQGPLWAARNWSANDGAGSIHDDATAAELGFRGGTVAGDVHMNQFPPVLIDLFGKDWFEHGYLSLIFRNATIDREQVQVFAETPTASEKATRVWMERSDGLLVCEGTAGLGDPSQSAVRSLDYRPCSPSELRILRRVEPGMSLGDYEVVADPSKQFSRFDQSLISDPLPWYREASPWGEPVGAPCTLVEYLWGSAMRGLGPLVEESTGLFSAIEIVHVNGPFLMNQPYRIQCEVVCVGQSPKTEFVWYDQHAYNEQGVHVASLRMQSRAMKASSKLYDPSEL